MPYISIETNKKLISGDFNHKLKRTSEFVAELLGKPEKWVMVAIKPGIPMLYSGDRKPCALVELRSIGLPKDRCGEFSEALCGFLEAEFEISCDRIYIDFQDIDRTMFGWNKGTF